MSSDASINSVNLRYTLRKRNEIGEMFANSFGVYRNVECGLVHRIRRGIKRLGRHPDNDDLRNHEDDDEDSDGSESSDSEDDEDTQHSSTPNFIPVPLISVSVIASVVHSVAQVEITQVYMNKESDPIEVIYFFPVDSNGAVTHFQAEFDGRIIKGEVKPNEQAKAEYQKAVAKNQTAFLGEENKPDIFKVSIGHLKPGTEVKVIIGYVTEVKNEPDTNSIRFFLPTTVAPRYISESESDDKCMDIASNLVHSQSNSAPMHIKIIASVQGEISSIESPTHEITIEDKGLIPDKENWHKWVVQLDGQTTAMDRDFLLMITPKQPIKPRLFSETIEDGSTAVMVHFIPSFKLKEQKVELIFVLDRSGSMNGESILMAQKALMLLIHSMPADCYFNIIGFGSGFNSLFPKSKKYDDTTLKEATKYAGNLRANMGGTEILSPLKEIYSMQAVAGYLRQIFVVTDGEVSDTERVIGLVKSNAHKSRVFALGIGNSASHYLVEGVALAGGGTCAFVGSDENIQKQALGQLKNALQPALTEIKIKWEGVEDNTSVPPELNKEKTLVGYNKPIGHPANSNKSFIQAPEKIPPVFDGSQLVVFGVFPRGKPTGAVITALSSEGPLILNVEMSEENDVGSTKMLHRLASIKVVRELELGETETGFSSAKSEIIELAVKNGISSKYTSFVAVAEGSEAVKECWIMQTRHVPSQIPSGSTYPYGLKRCGGGGGIVSNPKRIIHTITARKSTCGVAPRRQLATRAISKSCSAAAPKDKSAIRNLSSRAQGGASRQSTPTPPRIQLSSRTERNSGSSPLPTTREQRYSQRSARLASSSVSDFESLPTAPPLHEIMASSSSTIQWNKNSATPMETERSPVSSVEDVSGNQLVPVVGGSRNITLHLVYSIINLQSFQGSFPLNPALSNMIGFDVNYLKAESLKNGWDETAWATSLAIVFLSDNLMEWKDYWELVVTKAQKWMELNHFHAKDVMISAARSTINLRRSLSN